MDKLKIKIEQEVMVTPNQVADLFCSMDGKEQALFFNHISENVKLWDHPFCFQLQAICDTEELTEGGKMIMKEIGDYSDGISWMAQKKVDDFIKDI